MQFLIDKGYSVVRTGSVANQRIPITDPAFPDCPFSAVRSDEMDVMLYACCTLAVAGKMSGLSGLAIAMRKPLVVCDVRPLYINTYSPELCRFIFSRMRCIDTGEVLSLEEMLNYDTFESLGFEAAGIEFMPNSADEIVTVTEEFLDALAQEQPKTVNSSISSGAFWQFVQQNGKYHQDSEIRPEFMPGLGNRFLQANADSLGLQD